MSATSPEPGPATATKLDAQLVAYLDGELTGEARQKVEKRLAKDETIRERLHALEKTWDLLNELPSTELGPQFASSTVEMVAQSVEIDAQSDAQRWSARRWQRGLIGGLAAMLAAVVGFTTVAATTSGANERLIDDLPIIEHLEPYLYAGKIDFLRSLQAAGMFIEALPVPDDGNAVATPATALRETPEGRRARIEAMTTSEQSELSRQRERFANLAPAERQAVRQLRTDLQASAEADILATIMVRHAEWHESQPLAERVELEKLAAEQRVDRVIEIQSRDAQRARDQEVLMGWIGDRLFAELPATAQHRIEQLDESERALALQGAWMRIVRSPNAREEALTRLAREMRSHIDELLEQLSEERRKQIQQQLRSPNAQNVIRRLMQEWAAGHGQQFRDRWTDRADIDRETLRDYYEQLDPVERDALDRLPADAMHERLLALYIEAHSAGPNRPRSARDGRRDRPPPPRTDRPLPPD